MWLARVAIGATIVSSPPEFVDEHGGAVRKAKEAVEHCLIHSFIDPESKGVLEIGARYGTSSCAISKVVTRNASVLVSVEADGTLFNATETNLRRNGCRNHLVHGVVGHHPMVKAKQRNGSPWTTKFDPVSSTDGGGAHKLSAEGDAMVPAYTPSALASMYGATFDTMVVDCEGCFAAILRDFPDTVRSVDTVMLEGDYGIGLQSQGYVDYNNITIAMLSMGFMVSEQFFHPGLAQRPNRIPMIIFQKVENAGNFRWKTGHRRACF